MERNQTNNRQSEDFYEEEIDIFELLEILWDKRFLILMITFLGIIAALIYIFLSPSQYLIQAQVKPRILSLEDFNNWFSQKGYSSFIARHFPEATTLVDITATGGHKGNTSFVRLYYPDPSEGKKILSSVLDHYLKTLEEQDRTFRQKKDKLQKTLEEYKVKLAKLALKRDRLTREILQVQKNIELKQKEENLLKDALSLHRHTVRNIQKVINKVQNNTQELIVLRTKFLRAISKGRIQSTDQLTLMLYSNIIQQNLSYLSSLEMRLLALKKEELELQKKMDALDLQIASLQKKLANLRQERDQELPQDEAILRAEKEKVKIELNNLQPFDILQPPISSPRPVKPKRLLIIVIAGLSGLFLGIFAAFFLHALETRKGHKKLR